MLFEEFVEIGALLEMNAEPTTDSRINKGSKLYFSAPASILVACRPRSATLCRRPIKPPFSRSDGSPTSVGHIGRCEFPANAWPRCDVSENRANLPRSRWGMGKSGMNTREQGPLLEIDKQGNYLVKVNAAL